MWIRASQKIQLVSACLCTLLSLNTQALALDPPREDELKPRMEVGAKWGNRRSIGLTELWMPFWQNRDKVVYGDLRFMDDSQDNNEGNLGLGYRRNWDGVVGGAHAWFDRRRSNNDSYFSQLTGGFELFTEHVELRVNGYAPLSDDRVIANINTASNPYLANTSIYVDTFRNNVREVPMAGGDIELGVPIPLPDGLFDSLRLYGGIYSFHGDDVESVQGWRVRTSADVTSWLQLGGRLQSDSERGTQGFLEATLRFPFNNKSSYREKGMRARLDESPERDVDIVSAFKQQTFMQTAALTNNSTSQPIRMLYVDNSAAGGGNGSLESPYNTLAAAQAVMQDYDTVYVHQGSSSYTEFALNRNYVKFIGSGSNLVFDGSTIRASTSLSASDTVLLSATAAPVLTSSAPNQDIFTITGTANYLGGVTLDGATRHAVNVTAAGGSTLTLDIENVTLRNSAEDGIHAEAAGAGSSAAVSVSHVQTYQNKHGMVFKASNNASMQGAVTYSTARNNTQHGIIVYDDSAAGAVNVDLGGGGNSLGFNSLYDNTLEDLAVEIDGGQLFAQNNWWGQAGGPYASAPSGGNRPQIYYGAPLSENLVAHWTLDSQWTNASTSFDRTASNFNAAFEGGMSNANLTTGVSGGNALDFNGVSHSLDASNQAALNMTAGFTFSAWVYMDAAPNTNGRVLSKDNDTSGNGGWSLGFRDNYPAIYYYGGGGQIARLRNEAVFSTGQWVLMTGTWNGTAGAANLALYLNGAVPGNLVIHSNTALPVLASSQPVNIGKNEANLYFGDGKLDDVRIYNRALTLAEVQELYRSGFNSTVNSSNPLNAAP